MVRNYIRKTTRGAWTEENMNRAIDAVRNDKIPFKTASKQFSVPVMALKRRVKGKNKVALGTKKYLGGKQPVFTAEQEVELVRHIKEMEVRMYGLTRQDVLKLAFDLAERNNIAHPFKNEKAGKEWLRGLRKRHPDIALRSPESTSTARARAFNKPVVDRFYSVWKGIQEEKCFPPHRIFNVDETSISTVPTKNMRVFAETGRKQVARVTSAERGETTTAVVCIAASGIFVPPMFIFRRIRMKMELMDGTPPGSEWACNASGWMNIEVFTKWFDHFLYHVKPSIDDPAVLILDGHLSHTKNLNVVMKARENHVTILCLPPHCTHKLQPLDVSVMYPLSAYLNQSLEKWMNNNPGRAVTSFQIGKIFGEAYLKAAVPINAINGFAKTGIYPFNPDVFSDADFIAASTTEMCVEEEPEISPNNDSHEPAALDISPLLPASTQQISIRPNSATPSPTPVLRCPLSPLPSTSSASNICKSPSFSQQIVSQTENFGISPAQICPFPKISGPRRSNIKRRQAPSSILTSTPYKDYLEEEEAKKTQKENKRSKKQNTKKYYSKKMKGVGKGLSNKRKKTALVTDSEESSEEEDVECLFCTEAFSKDVTGEGWIQCSKCRKWGHESCAGIDSDDDADYFQCDICVNAPGKKRLSF